MLTVPQAARHVGRKPETIRRWIREGRLRASKVGTQHVIEERDLEGAAPEPWPVEIPERWRTDDEDSPQPDWVGIVRRQRQGH